MSGSNDKALADLARKFVADASVLITPVPTPAPTPKPTPAPTSKPTPAPTPTPTGPTKSAQGTLVTTVGPAIVNTALEKFTITAGDGTVQAPNGQVAVNGIVDATTANVKALLYWSDLVYQENASGNWYSKSVSTAAWVGPLSDPRVVTPSGNSLVVDFATPTGKVARSTAFGIACYSGADPKGRGDFGTMQDPAWQAAVKTVGGFGLFRSNPNGIQSVWPSRAAWDAGTPSWGGYNSFWLGLKAIGHKGRVVIGMGGGQPSQVLPAWMNPGSASDAVIYGKMAVKIAQQMIADGYTNPDVYFEAMNEPDGAGVSIANAAMYCNQVAVQLAAAGFPYKVGGPTIQNSSAARPGWVSGFKSAMGANFGFAGLHFYGESSQAGNPYNTGDGADRIANSIGAGGLGPSHGFGAVISAIRADAGGAEVLLGETSLYGMALNNPEQQTNVGAVFFATALLDAIKNGGLEMSAVWHAFEDLPNFPEKYGLINGATADSNGYEPWHIYPAAWTISRMFQKLPGNVVKSSLSPGSLPVYHFATVKGAAWAVAIVNMGTSAITGFNASLSNAPAGGDYFEVSADHLSPPLITTVTAAQMAALRLPPMSVVILSSSP